MFFKNRICWEIFCLTKKRQIVKIQCMIIENEKIKIKELEKDFGFIKECL